MAGTRGFILIVEDDDDLRHLMKTYLLREGYDVCTAEDGEQAKEALGQKTFQLAVLDLMLPQSDGLEVLRYIREKGNTPVLIVVLQKRRGRQNRRFADGGRRLFDQAVRTRRIYRPGAGAAAAFFGAEPPGRRRIVRACPRADNDRSRYEGSAG